MWMTQVDCFDKTIRYGHSVRTSFIVIHWIVSGHQTNEWSQCWPDSTLTARTPIPQLSNTFCLNSAILRTLLLNLATKKTPRATKQLLNNARTFSHLLVVAFAAFLRTGELLELKREHVTLGKDKAILFLPTSKGAKRTFIPLERVELTESTCLKSLKHLLKNNKSGTFWKGSRYEFWKGDVR